MGSDTRRNFRRYRRRAEMEFGAVFVPEAYSESQFLAFNRQWFYPFLP
jgi:hypothetical protein